VPFERRSVFPVYKENVGERFILTGCVIGSPLMKAHHARAGITDIYRTLVDSPDLLLVAQDKNFITHYLLYLKEHYHLDVTADIVIDLPTMVVCRIKSVPPPAPATTADRTMG